LPTLLAFVVAAAAFVVRDVGSNTADLRASLGEGIPSERAEFVTAAASVLVGLVAVVVATAAVSLLGPLSLSVPRWRASLALTLALVSLLAFSRVGSSA